MTRNTVDGLSDVRRRGCFTVLTERRYGPFDESPRTVTVLEIPAGSLHCPEIVAEPWAPVQPHLETHMTADENKSTAIKRLKVRYMLLFVKAKLACKGSEVRDEGRPRVHHAEGHAGGAGQPCHRKMQTRTTILAYIPAITSSATTP